MFFVALALDGFDQHYLASLHFAQRSVIDKSWQHLINWECRESNPKPGQQSKKRKSYHCAMLPSPRLIMLDAPNDVKVKFIGIQMEDQ